VRSFDDITAIDSHLENVKAAAVIGGGLVGIKTACALARWGIKVTLLISSNYVLSQMIDQNAGNMVRAVLKKNNIEV
jgi:NAD(P)H-nitrite reductase large subunit